LKECAVRAQAYNGDKKNALRTASRNIQCKGRVQSISNDEEKGIQYRCELGGKACVRALTTMRKRKEMGVYSGEKETRHTVFQFLSIGCETEILIPKPEGRTQGTWSPPVLGISKKSERRGRVTA